MAALPRRGQRPWDAHRPRHRHRHRLLLKAALNGVLFAVHADVYESDIRSLALRIDSNDVLIAFGPGFEFSGFAIVVALALQLVRVTLVAVIVPVRTVAQQDLAVLLQLVLIVRDDFAGGVVSLVLHGHHLHP